MAATAIIERDSIIQQVAAGALLKTVAQRLGVTPAAISQYLSKDREYLAARENGALARLEDQYQAINESDDALNLARAREGFRAASWFAEREFPDRWGAKQQIAMQVQIHSVDSLLNDSARSVLDGVFTELPKSEALGNSDTSDNEHYVK